METAEFANNGFGDQSKLYQRRAFNCLPLLVRQAKAGRTILYSELASELSMSNPRNLNFVLGAVGREMEKATKALGRVIPPIQCLVINKHEGIPGEGIGWFVDDPHEFRKLPQLERERIIDRMLAQVFSFSGWDSVLAEYGMEPIVLSKNLLKNAVTAGCCLCFG